MADGTVDNNKKIAVLSDACIGFGGAGVFHERSYDHPAPVAEGYKNTPFQKEFESANPGFSQKTGIGAGDLDLGLKATARLPYISRNVSAALSTGGSTGAGLFYIAGGGSYTFGDSIFALNALLGGRFNSKIKHGYADLMVTLTPAIGNVEIEAGGGVRLSGIDNNGIASPTVLGLVSLTLYLNASKLAAD